MIKLSQCMIVKNEEENIEKALSWAKDVAYEQIVVDTGSTDRTVEIAEKMGAKVYHFEWIDDFSAAKNYALSKATGDWIAFLDADEYFEEEDTKKLMAYLEELQNTNYIGLITSWLHLNGSGDICMNSVQIRIFRNMMELRYYRAIHEVLELNGESIANYSINLRDELAIFHTGYAKSKSKKKGERNIRILLKEMKKNPQDIELMSYLGDAYLAIDDYEKVSEYFEKVVGSLDTLVRKNNTRIANSFKNLIKICRYLKNVSRMLEVYEQAIRVIPEESDFDYLISLYWIEDEKDFEKGLFYLDCAFQKLESNKDNFYGQILSGKIHLAWEQRITCYFELQNWTKCIENCLALLQADAYRYTTTKILLNVFQIDEIKGGANAKEVLQFLGKLYSLQNFNNRKYLLQIATEIHYDTMVLEIRNLFIPEELAAIDGSMS